MKILCANKFFYLRGGSEYVFFDTAELLKEHGHEVAYFSMRSPLNLPCADETYFVSNVDFENGSGSRIASALRLLYSWESRKKIDQLLKTKSFDLAHVHNIYHQISPSILHSLKKKKVPVVMTLHDSKLVCASYYLMRNGTACRACAKGKYHRCFLHACVKGSRAKSFLGSLEMYLHHRLLRIYDLVDIFIAPSIFLKSTMEEMGFKKKIVYLPNFVDAEQFSPAYGNEGKHIVYFGRVTRIKGVLTLLEAVDRIPGVTVSLIGDGDLKAALETEISKSKKTNIRFLGYKAGKELHDEIRKAACVVVPSECYENNPRAIIEAFALGKPVIGSKIGGIPELIKDSQNGYLFEAGNAFDLREKIKRIINDLKAAEIMGKAARAFVDNELNAQAHYRQLMGIYDSVCR